MKPINALLVLAVTGICVLTTTSYAAPNADRAARIEARRAALENKRAEAEARRAELKDKRKNDPVSDKTAKNIDQREARQEKRIEAGIKNGSLTESEVAKLRAQQDHIAALESTYRSDGKITKQEYKDLMGELNTASACIWAEKHDTEGNQMPTYRFGKNVFAKDTITGPIENATADRTYVHDILKEFHQMTKLKHELNGNKLTPAERELKQAKYNELLNKYFEVR
ncbi:MAG: hypothetical protein WCJ97_01350 [Phycisphaerae bacterium]